MRGAAALRCSGLIPVSYTHLDVYKRQVKTAADSVKESAARKNDQEELKATISRLTPEQLAAVKAQIERMQAEAAEEKAETAEEPAEEAVQEASAETENAEDTGSEEPAAE